MAAIGMRNLRPVGAGFAALLAIFLTTAAFAASPPSGNWEAVFSLSGERKPVRMALAPIGDKSLAVTILPGGADPASCTLQRAGNKVGMKLAGYDPVSRLAFLNPAGSEAPARRQWLERVGSHETGFLTAAGPAGRTTARMDGWVKQIGGKVLPLALLRVKFRAAPPPPGTALLDDEGRIAALILRERTEDGSCFAIPAEAVLRVFCRVAGGLHPGHGRVGLTLAPENKLPRIVRVLDDSPAATCGILPGDVLLAIGDRSTGDYADAVNAIFYLVPEQPVPVKFLRAGKIHEVELVPAEPQD